jgi:hypothetical protein
MPIQTIPALGQYGLVADQPPQELPDNAFSNVLNVRFRDGCAERFLGDLGIFSTPSVTPYYITPFGTVDKRYWVHCGLASVFADDGTTRTDITGAALTGGIDDRFTGGALSGILILNNGVDIPRYWAGSGNTANLTGWDSTWRAKFIRTFKNYIIYGAPTKNGDAFPHTLGWSSAADPGTLPTAYTAAAGNDAGDVPVGETPDLLVDSLTLGEVHIVYKEQSCYRMEYVGGQQVFSVKRIPGNYGMVARGCAVSTPMGHVVLANGDVVINDGVSEPKSILTGRLRKWLFSTQIDSTVIKRCFVTSNPTKNEVWICYPSFGATACARALVWNWVDNTFGVRELDNVTYAASGLLNYTQGNTWADYSSTAWKDLAGAWNANDYTPADSRLIMATTGPKILLADVRGTFDGTPMTALLERSGMAFGDPSTVKCWKGIRPRIDAPAGTVVMIQLGGAMDAEQAPSFGDWIPYTVGSTYKADGFYTGRFLAYRIRSTSVQPWRIKSMDAEFVPMGKY